MSSKAIKKLLLSLIVVGVLGSFTARGTYAVLTGEGSNPNESIASGTLTMTETLTPASGSDTPCTSQSGALNVNTGCFTILSSATAMYPIPSASPAASTYQSAHISVQNTGTLPETLKIYMPSCTASATAGTPTYTGAAINPCCPGGATPCLAGSLDFFIQETNAPTGSPRTWTNLSSCIWPVSASAQCTLTDDQLGSFYSLHRDNTHYLSLGAIAAGATRYFQIAVAEPIDAANGLQGQTATFALYWHAE
jgi:hypothetical protein